MTPDAGLAKPGSAKVKPLDTTNDSELDGPTAMSQEAIAAKLVLRPWRVRLAVRAALPSMHPAWAPQSRKLPVRPRRGPHVALAHRPACRPPLS